MKISKQELKQLIMEEMSWIEGEQGRRYLQQPSEKQAWVRNLTPKARDITVTDLMDAERALKGGVNNPEFRDALADWYFSEIDPLVVKGVEGMEAGAARVEKPPVASPQEQGKLPGKIPGTFIKTTDKPGMPPGLEPYLEESCEKKTKKLTIRVNRKK
jgi:hypothetical protein